MSLAGSKASKRYKDKHRAEHRKLCKKNYYKNKEERLKKIRARTREITEGARRWRKIVGGTILLRKDKNDLLLGSVF